MRGEDQVGSKRFLLKDCEAHFFHSSVMVVFL